MAASRSARHAWSDRLLEAAEAYSTCWQKRNKRSGLPDVMEALKRVADEMRDVES
jgi:hypothetical protein